MSERMLTEPLAPRFCAHRVIVVVGETRPNSASAAADRNQATKSGSSVDRIAGISRHTGAGFVAAGKGNRYKSISAHCPGALGPK